MSAKGDISGAAQHPRVEWVDNADGPRTETEALGLARKHGVELHDDVWFVWDYGRFGLREGDYARYGGFQSYQVVTWNDFLVQGRLPVKVWAGILRSDEAIVAVLGHEMYEINALREMLADGRSMTGTELRRLIGAGIRGNLHDRAWDEADRLVLAMREERE